MIRIITTVLVTLILLLGASFAILNADPVQINYYIGERTLPLSILLVITLGAGLFIGMLVSSISYFKYKRQASQLKGRIKVLEKEVDNLRAIPLKD